MDSIQNRIFKKNNKMSIKKKPFTRYNLKIEDSNVITIRINVDERMLLEEFKELLNVKSDSKALKIGVIIAKNVIHRTLGSKLCRYLFLNERVKLSDFKNF